MNSESLLRYFRASDDEQRVHLCRTAPAESLTDDTITSLLAFGPNTYAAPLVENPNLERMPDVLVDRLYDKIEVLQVNTDIARALSALVLRRGYRLTPQTVALLVGMNGMTGELRPSVSGSVGRLQPPDSAYRRPPCRVLAAAAARLEAEGAGAGLSAVGVTTERMDELRVDRQTMAIDREQLAELKPLRPAHTDEELASLLHRLREIDARWAVATLEHLDPELWSGLLGPEDMANLLANADASSRRRALRLLEHVESPDRDSSHRPRRR